MSDTKIAAASFVAGVGAVLAFMRFRKYVPPKVWAPPKQAEGQFASINSHKAGARTQLELPVGTHDLQLHSLATPNGVKVTIMLEELVEQGLLEDYDAFKLPIDGKQFSSGFVAINPNSKIPAMVDRSVTTSDGKPMRVFESGSILVYLAVRELTSKLHLI